jgi:hypothetical protein
MALLAAPALPVCLAQKTRLSLAPRGLWRSLGSARLPWIAACVRWQTLKDGRLLQDQSDRPAQLLALHVAALESRSLSSSGVPVFR